MGSCTIATRPTITIRMEITMATMGRSMKNLAIAGLLRGLGPNLLAGARAVDALDDDPLARLQSLRDDPQRAHARARLHGPYLDCVVGLDDGDLVHALDVLHGPLRDEERVLLHLDDGPNLGVLAGAQDVAGIGKDPPRQHRAGR